MTNHAVTARSERLGIALRIGSTLAFVVMVGCIKVLGTTVPLGQVVFFRSAVALVPLISFLWWCGDFPGGLWTHRPFGHIARCLLGALSMFTSFATIRLLPLAEATMLSYLAPVLVALMGWAFLGERLGMRRIGGIALGFGGVAVFCLPAFSWALPDTALLGLGLGLLTAFLTAGALVQVRRLTVMGEKAGAIALWFAFVSALGGLATLPFGWVSPSPSQIVFLVAAGLSGGIAHILMTLSFRHAEAAALAPYEYLSVLWAAALGLAFFQEAPAATFYLAAPLILLGAIAAMPVKRRS